MKKVTTLYGLWDNKIYEGELVHGKFNGNGKLYYEPKKEIGDESVKYEGEFKDGKFNGYGVEYTRDGLIVYEGQWYEDKYHGKGKLYDSRGEVLYEGIFYKGKPIDIRDAYLDKEGKKPIENLKDDYYILYDKNGNIHYKGFVINGRFNGTGTVYHSNGYAKYEGKWDNGLYHGKGKTFFHDGYLKYEGEWFEGMKEGKGRLFWENGQICYDGYFSNDSMNGYGKMYYKSGQIRFEGYFKEGQFDILGTEYREDGSIKYSGTIKPAKYFYHGDRNYKKGILYKKNNIKAIGYFDKQKLCHGIEFNETNQVIRILINYKECERDNVCHKFLSYYLTMKEKYDYNKWLLKSINEYLNMYLDLPVDQKTKITYLEKALEMLTKITYDFPNMLTSDHIYLWEDLARYFDCEGFLNKAIYCLRQQVKYSDYQHRSDPFLNMGVFYTDAGKIEEAIEAYQEGLDLSPDDEYINYNLSALLMTTGYFKEAKKTIMNAIEANPNRPINFKLMGDICYSKGEYIESKEYYLKALDKNLISFNENMAFYAMENIIDIYKRTKRKKEAIFLVKTWINEYPEYPNIKKLLSRL